MNDSIFSHYNTQSFTYIIRNPYWQTLFLLLGAFYLDLFHKSVLRMDTTAYQVSSVKLQGFKTVNGNIQNDLQSYAIRLFFSEQEILDGSCRASSNRSESLDTVDFPSPVCVNNGILIANGEINQSDRMAFILWGSKDSWKSRFILASSGARWTQAAARHSLRAAIQAESTVQLDLYPPWPWLLDIVAPNLILGSASLLLVGCGRLNMATHAKRLLHAHALLLAAAQAVAAGGYAARGRWREAASPAACCAAAVAASAALARARRLLRLGTALALAALAGRAADDCALGEDCLRLVDEPPLAAASLAALGAACLLRRRRRILRAARDVAADQARCASRGAAAAALPSSTEASAIEFFFARPCRSPKRSWSGRAARPTAARRLVGRSLVGARGAGARALSLHRGARRSGRARPTRRRRGGPSLYTSLLHQSLRQSLTPVFYTNLYTSL